MSFAPLFDVVVGLVLVYYILGLVVSFITARILEVLELRGKDLEEYLRKIVGGTELEKFLALPQIESLRPIRYKGVMGFFTGSVEPKRLERVPILNLVDAVFQMYHLIDNKESVVQLKHKISNLPDSNAKTNLLNWIDQQVTDIDQLRSKTTMWLTGLMNQASMTYKAHIRLVVIGLSLLVTLALGVDTLDFANRLWYDADLRAIVSAKAEVYLAKEGAAADIEPLIKDLGELSFQMGWWATPPSLLNETAAMSALAALLKKLVGLFITFVAVSQGASFWYDILRRLKGEDVKSTEKTADGVGATADQ